MRDIKNPAATKATGIGKGFKKAWHQTIEKARYTKTQTAFYQSG